MRPTRQYLEPRSTLGATDLDHATWEDVDRRLRRLARRRAALDAEELQWLFAAQRVDLHVRAGFGSLLEYLVVGLRYSRRAARERLRVAAALAGLPMMMSALADGRLTFSAVRELVRVATPATEGEWVHAARGMTVREIELLIASRARGSRPDTASRPRDVQLHRLNLRTETLALFVRAKQALEAERGVVLSQDEAIAAMSQAVLRRAPASADSPPASPARATASYGAGPVWHVAGGRCAVPGCRSRRELAKRVITVDLDGRDARSHAPILCSDHRLDLDLGRLHVAAGAHGGVAFAEATGAARRPRGAAADEHPGSRRGPASASREAGRRSSSRGGVRARPSRRGAANQNRERKAPVAPAEGDRVAQRPGRGAAAPRAPGSARATA